MENKIKRDLLRIGILNFISSILFLIFAKETDLIERLFGVLAINVGYFMFYFFIGKLVLTQVKWLKKNSKEGIFSLQKKMADFFARGTKIFAFIVVLLLIFTAYSDQNFSILFAIFLPLGIYFGGVQLKAGLTEIK